MIGFNYNYILIHYVFLKEINHEYFYWCEIYTKERFSIPLSRGEKVVIDYILPVKSKLNETKF